MIEVEHFSYAYGSTRAVDDISFSLKTGEIVALIGPNGAGKSTTMKVLTTLLRPCAGIIRVAGYDVTQDAQLVRQNLGYLPEDNPLYDDMIVADALASIAQQRRIPAAQRRDSIDEAATLCAITPVMHRTIDTLSRGYRQRVGIAQAILHRPNVLILDEATTGLDPNQIVEIRDLILQIGKQRTVLIATHILQEVSAIAKRVILLNRGKIALDAPLQTALDAIETQGLAPNIETLFRHYTKS